MKFLRSSIDKPDHAWILVEEGNPFLETQCLAIMEEMDFPSRLFRVSLPWIWQTLPLWACPNPLLKVKTSPKPLSSPWPTFVMCGGKTASKLGLYLKKKYDVYCVSLGTSSFAYDRVILESNIQHEQKNRILTLGPLHRIGPGVLSEARKTTYRKIDHLPKPRLGVFLEGLHNPAPLYNVLKTLHKKSPFSLMIYDAGFQHSRELTLGDIPTLRWDGKEGNPYLGFLAHSDAIVVTNTSSLLVAEATASGKPIYIYPTSSLNPYCQALLEKGYASLLTTDAHLFSTLSLPPIQEAQRVATLLKRSFLEATPLPP